MKTEQPTQPVLRTHYIPTAEFYGQVIDSLQDYSIFTLDNDFRINSWNSGATKIFQYESEEILGEHFEIIFSEEDRINGAPALEIKTALQDGRALDNRWHVCKDGSKFYAYGLVFPLTGINEEMLGYVKILRDLTTQKKAQDAINHYIQQLEELNTHKESVLAILSHDLRSPLASMVALSEHLQANIDNMEPDEVKALVLLIHKSAKDELNMLDYLVEWARIKYAAEVFSPTEIDLYKYVTEVLDVLHESAAANEINLYNKVAENSFVFADKKMLRSVLQNIVSNGIRHTPQGGKIIVSAECKDGKMVIQVQDTGAGMSEQVKKNLFTPQLKLLLKARDGNKGAGIGLLLVKGFLEKNGGEIWVESTEGKGSSFYFSLPAHKPEEPADPETKIELP